MNAQEKIKAELKKAKEEQYNVIVDILKKIPKDDLDEIIVRIHQSRKNPEAPTQFKSTESL